MRNRQAGFNMLEILFSLLIVTTGLLGLAATQVVAQRAEQESYQRAQAIVLMTDIVDRINTNSKAAICYNISDPATGAGYLGATGSGKYNISSYACPALATNPAAVSRAQLDMQFIDEMLLGSGEKLAGNQVGAMLGARTCIGFDTASQSYTVAIAWQGTTATFSPASWPAANNPAIARNCALNLYGTGSADAQRRVVWTTIMVASLN
jgi:type IV pilus assembly protein PilV